MRAYLRDAGYRSVDAQTRPEKAAISAGKMPSAGELYPPDVEEIKQESLFVLYQAFTSCLPLFYISAICPHFVFILFAICPHRTFIAATLFAFCPQNVRILFAYPTHPSQKWLVTLEDALKASVALKFCAENDP